MATDRVQIVVRLPADVVARLRQERQETGRSLQAILEDAVTFRLEFLQAARSRRRGPGYGDGADA